MFMKTTSGDLKGKKGDGATMEICGVVCSYMGDAHRAPKASREPAEGIIFGKFALDTCFRVDMASSFDLIIMTNLS